MKSLVLRFGCILSVVVASSLGFRGNARADEARIAFNRDIRPILSNNCYKCHGPDAKERQAGLRLDTQEGATAALTSGERAVVPGKLAESALVARITASDPADRMPPAGSGKTLTPQQIELLKKWVEQGAEYQGHWSFIAPARIEPPKVTRADAVRNAIDRFVLARLEKERLQPSPPADKVTLIRRATLDLTGMPPTPAEVDALLADKSPDAYEKLIDRLLRSPRYGEHMARQWLDLARYGDTHGLHLDNERAIWRYREWVMEAFNANLPFDRFTVEQLAGDLLPNPTLEQKIATGFNRCNVTTGEGGSIDEEVRIRYVVDRTETMANVFMGLTLGCAVCHDHKFDPVTQKEFYQLSAFYNSAADPAMDGNVLSPPPFVKAPTAEQAAQLQGIDEKIAQVRQRIAETLAKVQYAEPKTAPDPGTPEPREYVWIDDAAPSGAKLQGNSPWEFVTKPHPVYSGEKATRRSVQGLSQHFFDSAQPGLKIGEGDRLFAYVYLDPKNPPKEVMLQFNDGTWEHRAYWGDDVIPWGNPKSPSRQPMGTLPKAGEWTRLEVAAAQVGLKPGAVLNGWAFTQHDGTVYWDKAGIVTRTPQAGSSFESLAQWEAYERAQSKSEVPQGVRDAIKVEAAKRNDQQKKLIRDYFLENVYAKTRPVFEPLHKETAALNKQRTDLEAAIPVSLVMADLPTPRDTFVLFRGQYNKPRDKVAADVPAAFPRMPKDAPKNRLGLAKWLVDPSHPLTARVTVNRVWQQFFGRGIVRTSEDFGSQGEWPSHPELLDWLSVEFRESGWNVKQLVKLILMSATYQQSSRVTPELVQRDPENVLLARGPRFRLDAEAVRDSALFASGLLVEKLGGKSVRTYQPPGIWEAIAFVGSNTREFKRDDGQALYRRSMYTFWKRTAPPPSLMAFDAPSRENCVARRARTNTPLQALTLMNDEQYVEAARHLAERMMKEGGSTPQSQLTYGFRLCTGRTPESREQGVLAKQFQKQLEHYAANKDAAVKLLSIGVSPRDMKLDAGQHAAYTMMANLMLNLDEAITKE
jgi:hypothetical protein